MSTELDRIKIFLQNQRKLLRGLAKHRIPDTTTVRFHLDDCDFVEKDIEQLEKSRGSRL